MGRVHDLLRKMGLTEAVLEYYDYTRSCHEARGGKLWRAGKEARGRTEEEARYLEGINVAYFFTRPCTHKSRLVSSGWSNVRFTPKSGHSSAH